MIDVSLYLHRIYFNWMSLNKINIHTPKVKFIGSPTYFWNHKVTFQNQWIQSLKNWMEDFCGLIRCVCLNEWKKNWCYSQLHFKILKKLGDRKHCPHLQLFFSIITRRTKSGLSLLLSYYIIIIIKILYLYYSIRKPCLIIAVISNLLNV